ncbi:MAG: endonuclease [Planctomycetaceae bacterium]|nr:endonuclease [Planctomycetaceae bacterium]
MASRKWTRDELLLAMNLYCQLPFGKLHQHNPEIIQLAAALDRTPSSIAMKLVNLASLDPLHQQRGAAKSHKMIAKCSV